MLLRGIVQTATLQEHPPGSDQIELVLRVQGVGPGQPRALVVPFHLLLDDPTLDADSMAGHGFQAEVEQAPDGRWMAVEISLAPRRVLREPD